VRPPLRVFISSRTTQSASERRAAAEAIADLAREGFSFVEIRAEELPAEASSPQRACLEKVRECDVFLGIFGKEVSEPVLEEYQEALAGAKPCLLFIEEVERKPEQRELLARITEWSTGHFVHPFSNPDELKYEIARALRSLIETFLPGYLERLVEELENLPLLPIERRALTIGDLAPRVLVEHRETGGGPGKEKRLTWLSPGEALARHERWILVGPGGSGKTTTLRSLAHSLAREGLAGGSSEDSGPIPVLLRLSARRGDLLTQVATALEVQGLRCDPSLVRSWLQQRRVVLLLDGLDEVSDPRLLVAEIEDLVRLCPRTRLVLASRPGARGLSSLPYPVLQLDRLDDRGMAKLFAVHLGRERGDELYQTLASANLLDPFRQPLMAWFAALAFRDPEEPILPGRGALYRRVIERDWLGQWEAERAGGPPSADLEMRVECLARLGREMVERNSNTIETMEAERLCREALGPRREGVAPGVLLGELCELRLLEKSERGFAFWHASFRDYFAAVWLERHFRLTGIALLTWQENWHEALIFLVSLLDDKRAARVLRHLFFLTRWANVAGSLGYAWGPNRLFLLLRCLINVAGHETLKDRFIDLIARIPERYFHLGFATAPVHSPYFSHGVETVYAQFYTQAGELRTVKSFEYLQKSVPQRYRVLGLARSGRPDALAVLVDEFRRTDEKDLLADWLTARVLLEFPPDALLKEVQTFFQTEDLETRRRLLDAINSAVSWSRKTEPPVLPNNEEWVDFLTEIFLNEEEETSQTAMSILRKMGRDLEVLPERAENTLLATMGEMEPALRSTALRGLIYSETARSLEAIIRAVDDKDPAVQLTALHALHYRDTAGFPTHVARVVEKASAAHAEADTLFSSARILLAGRGMETPELERSTLLVAGALAGEGGLRLLSVQALLTLRCEAAVPVLKHVFRKDEAVFVRKWALIALVYILEDRAEPVLEEAIGSAESALRAEAIRSVAFHLSPELLERWMPRLEILHEEDPNESVRREAGVALVHWQNRSTRHPEGSAGRR
jgi:NACHT domain/Domain of unknown function (DUF4062)